MKVPGTPLTASGDLAGKADGTYLFQDGTDTSKKGFLNTNVFEEIYKAAKAEAEIKNNTTPLTLVVGKNKSSVDYKASDGGLKQLPTVSVAVGGSAGYKYTFTAIVEPSASSDFSTNGKLYSAAALTLSQMTASACYGIAWRGTASAAAIASVCESPTIKASNLIPPQVDGVSADSYSYTTNSGMALTSGTVTASNSTVQAFKVGANGSFGINVTHSATLKDAITTTAIQVQQVTCLDVYTAKDPKQWLCILTDIATAT